MKKFFLPVAFCLATLPLLAQSQQQVVVREYQEKQQKTPLEGVSLSVQNAGSTLSNAAGEMTLQFRSLKAGDAVQVRRVDLAGFEVFNRDAVEQWTISPQHPFQLVLCRSEKFRKLREEYMRVSSASYERQYKKEQARLASLRKQNKINEEDYQSRLADLQDSYNEQLDNLDNYVDRFARIDLSELSAQEQRLVELVQEGKIDEAIELYESADYLGQYTQQVEDIKKIEQARNTLAKLEEEKLEARQKVQAAIGRQVQTYQLAGGEENFCKIGTLLKGVADADTTNLQALTAYVLHCINQNLYDDGNNYAQILLRQSGQDLANQALANFQLGKLFYQKLCFDEAGLYLSEAARLAQLCYDAEPARFESLLTMVQSSLHSYLIYIGSFNEAQAFSSALLERLLRLCAEEPDTYREALATHYAEQGTMLFFTAEDILEAEPLLLKAYALAKEHAEATNHAEASVNTLMSIITNLYQFYYETQQWEKMLPLVLEEQQHSEKAYQKNPRAECRSLANNYNNQAELYIHLGRYADAHLFLDKATAMLAEAVKIYGETSLQFDFMCLYDVASQLYQAEGNTEQMRHYARLCVEAYEQMPPELQAQIEEVAERNRDMLK